MMCKVNVSTTLEEQTIHVEESGDPDSLVYAAEGEEPAPLARLAWRGYISTHCNGAPCALQLLLQPSLPAQRLNQVQRAFFWLVSQIIHKRAAKSAYP